MRSSLLQFQPDGYLGDLALPPPTSLSDLQMRPDMPWKSEGMPGKAADEGRGHVAGLGKEEGDAPVSLPHLASFPELQVVIRNTAAWSRSPY